MAQLACQTPAGDRYLDLETQIAQQICASLHCTAHHLPAVARVDRLFTRGGAVVGVGEVKCRNLSRRQLDRLGSYLVSAAKLDGGVALARTLGVPFLLFVYLIPDAQVVWWLIANGEGRQAEWATEIRTTAKTCEGGEKQAQVALLSLNTMRNLIEAAPGRLDLEAGVGESARGRMLSMPTGPQPATKVRGEHQQQAGPARLN